MSKFLCFLSGIVFTTGIFLLLRYGRIETSEEKLKKKSHGGIEIHLGYDPNSPYISESTSTGCWHCDLPKEIETGEWREKVTKNYKSKEDAIKVRNKIMKLLNNSNE